MFETVLILGAGVSKPAGAPLMDEFLNATEDLFRGVGKSHEKESVDRVIEARNALNECTAEVELDFDNLESLFSAIEMAQLIHRLGPLTLDALEELSDDMRMVIRETLGRTIKFPMRDGFPCAPSPYDSLADIIMDPRPLEQRLGVAVISFNYDLCLEMGLRRHGVRPDYALKGSPNLVDPLIAKLHGSLNWFVCDKCDQIAIGDISHALRNWERFMFKIRRIAIINPDPRVKGKFEAFLAARLRRKFHYFEEQFEQAGLEIIRRLIEETR